MSASSNRCSVSGCSGVLMVTTSQTRTSDSADGWNGMGSLGRLTASLHKDENETAYTLVQAMIGEGPRPEPPGKREKNPEAVDRCRAGGKKGGTGGRCGAAHPTRAKGEAGMSDGVIGTLRDPSLPPK